MTSYRRGQVEWALWRFKAGEATPRPAPSQFLARIKRLLDVDRTLAPERRRRGAAAFAFSTAAPGGRGENAAFAKLDATMLWLALELVELGFKQQEVVEQLRRARALLGRELGPLLAAPAAAIEKRGARFAYRGPSDADMSRFLVLPRVEAPLLPWTRVEADGLAPSGPLLLGPGEVEALLRQAPQAKVVIVPAALPAFSIGQLLERAPEVRDGRQAKPPVD